MMFEVKNPALNLTSHCGVEEFSADEGIAFIPHWMMENLCVADGGIISIANVTLPKASFVQLQPYCTAFIAELNNPKIVLEKALRKYSSLTKGERIVINYRNSKFELEVVEVKPGSAVSIIETDVNVDFKEPKDHAEYEARRLAALNAQQEQERALQASPPIASPTPASASPSSYFASLGSGNRLSGKKKTISPCPTLASGMSLGSPTSCYSPGDAPGRSAPTGPPVESPSVSPPKFTYTYKEDEATKTKKLVRRQSSTSAFQAFSGKGNSLK